MSSAHQLPMASCCDGASKFHAVMQGKRLPRDYFQSQSAANEQMHLAFLGLRQQNVCYMKISHKSFTGWLPVLAQVDPVYFPHMEVVGDIGNGIWQIKERLKDWKPTWDLRRGLQSPSFSRVLGSTSRVF